MWVEADSVDDALRTMTAAEAEAAQPVMQVEIEQSQGDTLRPDERIRQRMDRPVRAQLNEYLPRSVRISSFRKEAAVLVSE